MKPGALTNKAWPLGSVYTPDLAHLTRFKEGPRLVTTVHNLNVRAVGSLSITITVISYSTCGSPQAWVV